MDRPPVKLGVMISGSGTNLQAIIDAILRGDLKAEIRLVISNRADAQGLERARRHGIQTQVIEHRKFPTREDFDRAVLATLNQRSVELVICAGFMRLFSAVMLDAFPGRIMNIHPGLSPAFPGIHAQRDALELGVKIAGCTVFFVTAGVDVGPIILQAAVPVLPGDDESRLAARILQQEHRILPHAIRLFQQGRLEIEGRRVIVKGEPGGTHPPPLINPPID
ncbi:MAG: phosphoribosylglycinamide formyltransferase [Candidatus Binatus sp.]|uniref:phosphoribosylglycinamide formyltransferase n=1 Tax=Candidatus Binatus sp. TaxID=2811406 RepID=UPI00271C9D23|nr:phosphoribosylglycinamide formyltransferase [Candidatus Binatus sp.]MDO8433789.1 phosphoribosylglycinamide formyltransferase [Candidatus Binatus sp.]